MSTICTNTGGGGGEPASLMLLSRPLSSLMQTCIHPARKLKNFVPEMQATPQSARTTKLCAENIGAHKRHEAASGCVASV